MKKRIVVGISGASGMEYARVLLRELAAREFELYLVITGPGKLVMEKELGIQLQGTREEQEEKLKKYLEIPFQGQDRFFLLDNRDLAAPVASGSFPVGAMVIIPCSMATVSGLARGSSGDLLERAADVAIKEGRKLVLVPRETPLSPIHLQNLLQLSRLGVTILPAMPAFYHQPSTLEDLVNFVAGRVLEQLGLEHDLYPAWGENEARPGRGKDYRYKVGILQLASPLDDAVEGFKSGLSSYREASFSYDYRNVEGKVPLLAAQGEEIVKGGVDLVFACTTPAARAAAQAAQAGNIPVVFTPVLDPVMAGLAQSWEGSGSHLAGVSGLVSPRLKLQKLKEVCPGLRGVTILQEEGNPNTAMEVEHLLPAAAALGLRARLVKIENPEDLYRLGRERFRPGEGLVVPLAPLIEQNIQPVIKLAREQRLPLLVPGEGGVKAGALLALSADHYELGVSAGKIAAEILQGRDPAGIPIGRPQDPGLFINLTAARYLGLKIPAQVLEEAAAVY